MGYQFPVSRLKLQDPFLKEGEVRGAESVCLSIHLGAGELLFKSLDCGQLNLEAELGLLIQILGVDCFLSLTLDQGFELLVLLSQDFKGFGLCLHGL